ncbi:RHS repeat-associated core domain-containing protein [Kitasatospora saccharophila]|uniref:RHS repeat-associated core domain-containing protein n=1 Tax=Kitasatospora saccharophila TaxID=407973 RepID=UPI00363D71AD
MRTYSAGGKVMAVVSNLPGGGVSYLIADPHDTATLAVDTTSQAVSRKQYKPYGQTRGTSTGWPDPTRGFLAKPVSPTTGYTDVGAREYDPVLGRFISGDPVLQADDPQQLGGYAYAGSNPTTHSDPTGLSRAPVETDDPQLVGSPPPPPPCGGMCKSAYGTDDNSGDDYNCWCYDGYEDAKNQGWGTYEEGGKRVFPHHRYATAEQAPKDNGIIMVRFYIQDKTAVFGELYGDNRSWSDDPKAGYRMELFWDTATGEVSFTVAPSHTTPSEGTMGCLTCGIAPAPAQPSHMIPAKDIVEGPMNLGVNVQHQNSINANWVGPGGLNVDIHGINSMLPVFAVDTHIKVDVNECGSVGVGRVGDAYPNMEVVQYRRGQAPKTVARDEERGLGGLETGFNAMPWFKNTDRHWSDGMPDK